MSGDEVSMPNVWATFSAFVRIVYTEMLTVVLLSVAFTLTMIPVVTLGSGLVALVHTMQTVVLSSDRPPERDRLKLFVSEFRAHLYTGLPYTGAAVLAAFAIFSYISLVVTAPGIQAILGGLVGFYALIIVPVWLFRISNLSTNYSSESTGFIHALIYSGQLTVEYPLYTFLHLVSVGALIVICSIVPIALFVVLPGVLAVLEVLICEEVAGEGVQPVLEWYQNWTT